MTVRLMAFGEDIPMINDPWLKQADAMLTSVEIHVRVFARADTILAMHHLPVQIARFQKDVTLSTKTDPVFRLVNHPPAGWRWMFIKGHLYAEQIYP